MLSIQKIFRKKENIIFIIILIIIVYFVCGYFKKLLIENFGGSSDDVAFDVPTQKKWKFDQSKSWYKIQQNGYKINFSELGFTMPNSQLSILFLYMNFKGQDYWRNVFRLTNTTNNCCNAGDRLIAMWIHPDKTNNFHIRFTTDTDGNDGMDSGILLPMGIPVFIGLVFDNNIFNLYINSVLSYTGTFNNIAKRDSNAVLQIGDEFHQQDGNIYIKNFTMYDGVLTQTDINNVYDKLTDGSSETTTSGTTTSSSSGSPGDTRSRSNQNKNTSRTR